MNDGTNRPAAARPGSSLSNRQVGGPSQPANLADLLERVLDKGIVIAGDITLSLGTVEVLTLRIRLLIASVDKAQEIGINWWQSDPALSSRARQLEEDRDRLQQRLDRLEARLADQTTKTLQAPPAEAAQVPATTDAAQETSTATAQEPATPRAQEAPAEPRTSPRRRSSSRRSPRS
jgi:Gas vesicle protein